MAPDGDVILNGHGNGVVDAFVQAMEAFTGRHIVVVEYSEHTLGQSADAEAVCYVQLNIDGERPCGVGRSHDIVQASLAAILSALDGRGLVLARRCLGAVLSNAVSGPDVAGKGRRLPRKPVPTRAIDRSETAGTLQVRAGVCLPSR